MITADNSEGSDRTPGIRVVDLVPPESVIGTASGQRRALAACADAACCVLSLAGVGAAAVPLWWGLVLHQTPLVASGICGAAMCALALLNRVFAPPGARVRSVPFVAALEQRHGVLAACLGLAAIAVVVLACWWPG